MSGQGRVEVAGWGQRVWVDREYLRYYTEDGWLVVGSED
jgi:hypothetical protein